MKKEEKMKIAMAAEMQQLDRKAIEEYGIPGIVLMENAGQGTVAFMERELGSFAGKTVVIFTGPGNNGGDGLVIGRRIQQAGGHPLFLFALPPERLRGDAATNYCIVRNMQCDSRLLNDPFDQKAIIEHILQQHGKYPVACLVDALFGTGLGREITGHFARIISLIRELRSRYCWPVTAVDLPSGIDADTGRVLGTAVEADYTVTYGLAKPAHYLNGGPGIGKVHIVDISIPEAVVREAGLKGEALTSAVGSKLPERAGDSHKGSHGHLLVLGGSTGKTGAAVLTCRAALRSGCGLVTAAVPHDLNTVFEQSLTEAMTIALPCSTTYLCNRDITLIAEAMEGKKAVVLGPGIGTAPETTGLVLHLYRNISLPMVVDADALNILSAHKDILAEPGGPRILTPHPGEMARLTGRSTQNIQNDRISTALNLCTECSETVITVLKGAGTVIGHNHGQWAVNTSGNQGMATGGMGDVLAGLIGSLLAQGLSPWDAACAGVYLHGLAADILARQTPYGYLASEVAACLPTAIRECLQETCRTR